MEKQGIRYYPTTIEAIHLLVLYLVLEMLVDFPLALYDYNKDTNLLSTPWISFLSSFSITAFIFIYGYKKSHQKFSRVFALKGFNPLLLIPILLMLPAMQYLVGFLNIKIESILPAPPWFWELFERILNNHFGFWGAALKVVVFAPIVEEILFRGIIMHGLMRNYRSWYAILLSGILFSAYHLNPWQMSYTFFLGLLLGWIMVKTRSLPFAILVHALNNLLVLLSVTYDKNISEYAVFNMPQSENIKISIMAISAGILLFIAFSMRPRAKKTVKKTRTSNQESPSTTYST
ncbi:MAG: CPBP family intramembrane metalloprotease [Prolixibacteraceae bacterium]|nr:CPBP family intramembrane metalloprotease [Prolixibacteraceae bacterium]